MKRTTVVLVATLVLLTAQRLAQGQSSGHDFSPGYGYLPDGYGRLMSAQANLPPASAPNPAAAPSPTPMPAYSPEQVEGDFFGDSASGVSWQVIGEYLYIRPSNAEVAYAQVTDPTGTFPAGRTGVASPFYDPGFRVSAARALGDCAAIGVSYAYFDTAVDSTLLGTDNPQNIALPVRSLVIHPNSPNFGDLGQTAQATQRLRFQLADIDYKAAIISGPRYCLNVVVGARYASLNQHFDSSLSLGTGQVDEIISNVRFDGGGIRLGLEGERQSPSSGFLVYGKGTASFVAGAFSADYAQFQANPGVPNLVETDARTNRVITMLDFEVGAGWASEDGTIRVTGGWMVSGWYNTIKPSNYIRAVQNNDPGILDSPMENFLAFDGLVFRVEWRF